MALVEFIKGSSHKPTTESFLHATHQTASECKEPYALVTYDLAVAKIAKQIQATEKPLLDDVFLMFGSFHIEMSYFSSLG